MNIAKEGRALGGGTPSAEDLALIRAYTRGDVDAGALYTFPVVLCDNEVDRDGECFDAETVGELAELFVGKSGITDHEWRSGNQIARIYRTALERDEDRTTAAGERYVRLKAWAYMLRGETTAPLIADIEGGIKKEVSVSCSTGRRVCSVCGADLAEEGCVHVPGKLYGGKLCYTILEDMQDAYEWSFVAVPAQICAGVTKHFTGEGEQIVENTGLMQEVESMLRAEVLTLCGREGVVSKAMRLAAEKMDIAELMTMKRALLDEQHGDAVVQLAGDGQDNAIEAFLQR